MGHSFVCSDEQNLKRSFPTARGLKWHIHPAMKGNQIVSRVVLLHSDIIEVKNSLHLQYEDLNNMCHVRVPS